MLIETEIHRRFYANNFFEISQVISRNFSIKDTKFCV